MAPYHPCKVKKVSGASFLARLTAEISLLQARPLARELLLTRLGKNVEEAALRREDRRLLECGRIMAR